jgi:pyruvate/2-oxoglutarate dehydrogenase complex dihydrolipoamide dehydrogenase (E3) component
MPDQPRTPEKYDVLVLGSGEAGKYIAWASASSGKRAAVVERHYIGGSCANIACLPSKNFVHSAKVARYATMATGFGLNAPAPSVATCRPYAPESDAMVDGLIAMHQTRYAQGASSRRRRSKWN